METLQKEMFQIKTLLKNYIVPLDCFIFLHFPSLALKYTIVRTVEAEMP